MFSAYMKSLALKFPIAKRVVDQRNNALDLAQHLTSDNQKMLAEINELKRQLNVEVATRENAEKQAEALSKELSTVQAKEIPEFSKVVYSHWGEDSIIDFVFKDCSPGKYLDIGCYHPALYSNTMLLHKKGWSGVNVDPNPFMIQQFNVFRPGDKNINVAVGGKAGVLDYFNFHDWASSNTASAEFAEQVAKNCGIEVPAKRPINVVTLAQLMSDHFEHEAPDFMNIDVENLDVDALKSGDWVRWRPKVVAIEDFAYTAEEPRNSEIYLFMRDAGYRMFSRCIYTSFYIEESFNEKACRFR